MGHGSSKNNEPTSYSKSDKAENNEHNDCCDSRGKRMAQGAFMAANPAGALIAKAIRSSKKFNQNNTVRSTNDDEF
ncbi:unnamed protein product [Adineta steineri]|uniref:Uncharacterized protein n=1 Tax=Adineta steineri TaxID=433720 RepID=A0A813PWV0_9BILA|nr:unnamed protein product [Adineta steineri]CAF0795598.1 unnamed protein product [Adineta steineri]